MHPSPAFRNTDLPAARALMAAHPFATLCVNGRDGPMVALAPLVLSEDSAALEGHVARANPFWRSLDGGPADAVALFQGPNAYVSPSWYPSKAEHGRVVPTWNYSAVEVRGRLAALDAEETLAGLNRLTDAMEADRPQPWRVVDAPADYVDRLQRGIVGLRLEIGELIAVDKLSQNKDAADHAGVVAGLSASMRVGDRAIANQMKHQERTP
ncbi:MAG: FMN-binding negative transcriptional regulator [Pseudomonadota bacterium]